MRKAMGTLLAFLLAFWRLYKPKTETKPIQQILLARQIQETVQHQVKPDSNQIENTAIDIVPKVQKQGTKGSALNRF